VNRLVFTNINQLVTVSGNAPKCGSEMNDIGIIENGCVIVEDETIRFVGSMESFDQQFDIEKIRSEDIVKGHTTTYIDAANKALLPGFVDSHTHFVFGGYRASEFAMRLNGTSYMDIMKDGGGIAGTVLKTREASYNELLDLGKLRLNKMLEMGVTTVEGKSGYGLDFDTEIKQLEVMKELQKLHVVDVVATYLGPHSIPEEFKGNTEGYIDFVINEVLPIVVQNNLAKFADVFCEQGVFSVEESKYYLTCAKELGLKLKIHADEIVQLGGTELAASMHATSADHLLVASEQGMKDLAQSKTIATLLPATAFSLNESFAKARKLIELNVPVALATDFNPGSCFTHSIPLVISLAALKMKMNINEIIAALTINGACALLLDDSIGSIEVGKKADLVMLEYPTIDFLPYHLGMNIVELVVKNGNIVVDKRLK